MQDTENVMDFDSYELNKTWRMEPYHYGGILEPMIGMRWSRLEDLNSRQQYELILNATFVSPIPLHPVAECLTTNSTVADNEIISGQAGFRYTKFRDPFTFSGDFRVFTGESRPMRVRFSASGGSLRSSFLRLPVTNS